MGPDAHQVELDGKKEYPHGQTHGAHWTWSLDILMKKAKFSLDGHFGDMGLGPQRLKIVKYDSPTLKSRAQSCLQL